MSLAEIPQNHVRRNANLKQYHDLSKQSRPQAGLHNGDENPNVPSKPSPVSNMLKTSTETGDESQFYRKPPRVHVSSSHFSPLPKNVPAASRKRPHQTPISNGQHGRGELQVPDTIRQGGTASINSTFHTRGHTRSYQRPSLEDYSSRSMTQGTYNNHSLTYRGPPTSKYNYRRDVTYARPRSPYTYTTRLKRLGYRPSSPALSDLSRPAVGYIRGLGREPSSRTASPLSAHNLSRTPSPFRYVVNRSDPDLEHYPPNLNIEAKQTRSPSTKSTRLSIPRPSASVSSSSSSSRVYQRKSITNINWAYPNSSAPSPVFYDYTEDFQEHHNHQGPSVATHLLSDQQIQALGPGTYSESDGSPINTGQIELPSETGVQRDATRSHDQDVDRDVIGYESIRGDCAATTPQDLSDVPEQPEKEIAATHDEIPLQSRPYTETESYPKHSLLCPDFSQVPKSRSPVRPSSTSGYSRSSKKIAGEVTGSITSRLSVEGSASPTGSMFSVKSSKSLQPPRSSLSVRSEAHNKLNTPVLDVRQRETLSGIPTLQPTESLRGPSFEGHSKTSTEILSPTPDRSILSPSSRERFSKILSIDEDRLDAEPLEPPPIRQERMETPTQGIRSLEAWGNRGAFESFRRKHSPYIRSKLLKQSVATDVTVENSDSEEEPELTVGLRQTFCEDKRIVSQPREVTTQDVIATGSTNQQITQHVGTEVASSTQGSVLRSPLLPPGAMDEEDGATLVRPLPDIDKPLPKPPRKQPSFRSFSPPLKSHPSQFPLDFTALVRRSSEDETHLQRHKASPMKTEQENAIREDVNQIVKPISEVISTRNTVASSPSSSKSRPDSRPWNHDSNYPWNDEVPVLDVSVPETTRDSYTAKKPPRFKLNIQRPSSSIGSRSKLRNELRQSGSLKSPFASSLDLGSGSLLRRKRNPNLPILPGQLNSSHDIINSSRQRARFVDTFEAQSPTISLQLPSPNQEVRSFFSDDSSDIRPRGALRKRLSEFRARAGAGRGSSVGETHGYDRGLLSSALGRSRASGRSSRQSQTTAGASTRPSVARKMHWKVMDKIRMWVHRGEDKVRDWRWKMRYRRGRNRAASAPLYSAT